MKESNVKVLIGWMSRAKDFTIGEIKRIIAANPEIMGEVFEDKRVRRNMKRLGKAHIERYAPEGFEHPELINWWVNTDDDGTGEEYFWIIRGNAENAKRVLDEMGEPWEGIEIHSAYDCTGQWFRWHAHFSELTDRTFVTQSARMDV